MAASISQGVKSTFVPYIFKFFWLVDLRARASYQLRQKMTPISSSIFLTSLLCSRAKFGAVLSFLLLLSIALQTVQMRLSDVRSLNP